jgi:ABC-2 type transport system ATP-binding protein
MSVLEIENLTKSFGTHEVLKELNLQVPRGSVFGFVGQNGSGKTTTMKIVLGLLKADGGSVRVCKNKVTYGQTKTNKYIGYLPDVPEFYAYMKPMEYLRLCGRISGLESDKIKSRSEELLSLVGLYGISRRIGGFSRGMKQRLGIAQALLGEPDILLCDEPTSALDPIGRKEILDILSAVKGKTTVVFSTHILSDVERICDRIAVLHEGKLSMSGSLEHIKKQHRHDSFLIEFSTKKEAQAFLSSGEFAKEEITARQEESTAVIKVTDIRSGGQFLIDLLSEKKIMPVKFEVLEPSLENLFMEAVK